MNLKLNHQIKLSFSKSLIHSVRRPTKAPLNIDRLNTCFDPQSITQPDNYSVIGSFIVTNYININYWLAPLTLAHWYCPWLWIDESNVYGSISISILPLFSNGHFCMVSDPSESSKLLLIIDLCHQLYNEVRVGFEPVKNSNITLLSMLNYSSLVPFITVF